MSNQSNWGILDGTNNGDHFWRLVLTCLEWKRFLCYYRRRAYGYMQHITRRSNMDGEEHVRRQNRPLSYIVDWFKFCCGYQWKR